MAKDKLPRPSAEVAAGEPEEGDLAIPDEDEDEALLGLLAEPQVTGAAPDAQNPPADEDLAIPDEDEDEALLGLLDEPQVAASTAPAGDLAIPDEDQEAALGLLEPGDEDLLLLADEELMGLGN